MAPQTEHSPGDPAPSAGGYERINIFGHPNGIRVDIAQGHPLPAAPIGHFWRQVDGADGENR
jgi:hypothetical protein